MRFLPDSLAGRTLLFLGVMALLVLAGSAYLLHLDRVERFNEIDRFRLLDRITTLVGVLGALDDAERVRAVERTRRHGHEVTIDREPLVSHPPRNRAERALQHHLQRRLPGVAREAVRVRAMPPGPHPGRHAEPAPAPHMRRLAGLAFSIRLDDSSWLNIRVTDSRRPPPLAPRTLVMLLGFLVALALAGVIAARWLSRPMSELARAAERFGLGHEARPIPERGSREVRDTIRAFNLMQARLSRHLADRNLMLAAVSHDLRTPITSLRLRAEYIEDRELRDRTLDTLAEMEAIVRETLAFARDDAHEETGRQVDVASLVRGLCDDRADLGSDAAYSGPDRLVVNCRPAALRRAVANLLDNALKYGKAARAELIAGRQEVVILVTDDGPGIPADKLDAVFTPFYRLDDSRSRSTGGTGLGLAVARMAAHAHGGELRLENRPEGGLAARLSLPLLQSDR